MSEASDGGLLGVVMGFQGRGAPLGQGLAFVPPSACKTLRGPSSLQAANAPLVF